VYKQIIPTDFCWPFSLLVKSLTAVHELNLTAENSKSKTIGNISKSHKV
jgi:hypothetical protein